MSAIGHTFVEQNTPQTTTSASLSDVSGASIASGNFTAGKKYFLSITLQIKSSSNGADSKVDILHGSTSFLDAIITTRHVANFANCYHWFTVWTAVEGEGIKLQLGSNGSATASIDQIAMTAINLSDDVIENTDWFFAERTNDDSLSTTPTDGASVTFTPGVAGHDWLVLAYAYIYPGAQTSSQLISLLVRSGEASSADPEWRVESNQTNTTLRWAYSTHRVFNLGASSNTFKEQSEAGSSVGTRFHSAVFALNLNKFRNHSFAYTAADLTVSTTNYATEAQSIALTPAVQGNVYIGGYWGFDSGNAAREGEFRIQVDGSDQPAGQTSDNYSFEAQSNDNADEIPHSLTTLVVNMTAAEHTIDMDVSADGAGAAQHRSLWAFTMELGLTAYTLAADAGSYALSGTASTLRADRLLNAVAGTYALSGQPAGLLADRIMDADPGSYGLTGQDATLALVRKLIAESGGYNLAGQTAALKAARKLNAESGVFALTGQDATLSKEFILLADAGAYVLTGQTAALLKDSILVADLGTYAITGQDVALAKVFLLIAESGAYVVSGQAASILAERFISAEAGGYSISGIAAELRKGFLMLADSGSYALTGADAAILAERLLQAQSGIYQITGQSAGLARALTLTADSGSYTITGEAAQILIDRILQAASGLYVLGGQAAVLNYLSNAAELGTVTLADVLNGLALIADQSATAVLSDQKIGSGLVSDAAPAVALEDQGVGSVAINEAQADV